MPRILPGTFSWTGQVVVRAVSSGHTTCQFSGTMALVQRKSKAYPGALELNKVRMDSKLDFPELVRGNWRNEYHVDFDVTLEAYVGFQNYFTADNFWQILIQFDTGNTDEAPILDGKGNLFQEILIYDGDLSWTPHMSLTKVFRTKKADDETFAMRWSVLVRDFTPFRTTNPFVRFAHEINNLYSWSMVIVASFSMTGSFLENKETYLGDIKNLFEVGDCPSPGTDTPTSGSSFDSLTEDPVE